MDIRNLEESRVRFNEELFLLEDRLQKIRQINDEYDLEHYSYISFSGGKDSCVLSRLIDLALPGNEIPRIYINTGIEYRDMVEFVKKMAEEDPAIQIIDSGVNIGKMLKEKGYPFKSKEHSNKVSTYQKSGMTKSVMDYIGINGKDAYSCPEKLLYQFSPDFTLRVSDSCCEELKKKPIDEWAKKNAKTIDITGIRSAEGGTRSSVRQCLIFEREDRERLRKFHPLLVVPDSWIEWFIKQQDIKLCRLYKPPFNLKRTGCRNCPFSLNLQEQLDMCEKHLPAEKKASEILWKPVYDEYRRIGYRLRRVDTNPQP